MLARGVDMLWYPIGWTAGYLMLLVFVAAPLRRSGAYTLPDFAEFRVESLAARQVASWLVCLIGVLYLVPQFQGAGLTLSTLTGAPTWVGAAVVASVVLVSVVAGGMRSITLVQAFQYWLKLCALLVPLFVLWLVWHGDGSPTRHLHAEDWVEPLQGPHATYLTYSLIVATFLGTMGLPHVVVRFYTNHDGRAARRTTVRVLAMLSVFYLLPTAYGALGRIYASDLVVSGHTDSVVLTLPDRMLGGSAATLLTALLGAGAFAAFLSTSSGLVVSISGVLSQDLLSRRFDPVTAFRVGGVVAASGTLVLALGTQGLPVAHAVELAFAVAASTFCPLLLLGIWWRGLTAARRDRRHARRRGALRHRGADGDGRASSRAAGGAPSWPSRPCSRCRWRSRPWSASPSRTAPASRPMSGARWCVCICRRRSTWTAAATTR